MQTRYLVTYDISDDERRTAVYKTLRGYGDHLQYSVFRCDLTATLRAQLTTDLHPLIDHASDQILIIDLGPVDGRAETCVTFLGRRYSSPARSVVII